MIHLPVFTLPGSEDKHRYHTSVNFRNRSLYAGVLLFQRLHG